MAKVHVLQMTAQGHFDALVHFNMPAGNNSAGVSWKAAALAAGLVGNTAHSQADEDEKAAILAGDRVELRIVLSVNPTGKSVPELVALVDKDAEAAKAAWIAEQQKALKYWGYKQGTVS